MIMNIVVLQFILIMAHTLKKKITAQIVKNIAELNTKANKLKNSSDFNMSTEKQIELTHINNQIEELKYMLSDVMDINITEKR